MTALIPDTEIGFITVEAISYFARADLRRTEELPLSPSQDPFRLLPVRYPAAWEVMSRLAQQTQPTQTHPAVQADPDSRWLDAIRKAKPGMPNASETLSGMSRRISPSLAGYLQALAAGQVDSLFTPSWKHLTRHPEKLYQALEWVFAHGGAYTSLNYYIEADRIEVRQPLLPPLHGDRGLVEALENRTGLQEKHAEALAAVRALTSAATSDSFQGSL